MFKSAESLESCIWDMKLADQPRSSNRALINDLFNGEPPYSNEEQEQNNINTNVNFLESNKIFHSAKQKFEQAFGAPGNYLTVKLDSGPSHKRTEWGQIITTSINKYMKRSLAYHETLNNVFAQVVLHGIGPVTWPNRESWCPTMHMMGDVLFPSRTLLTMENVPYFAVYKQFTAYELIKRTQGPVVDNGWSMETVKSCLEWASKQRGQTMGSNSEAYSPEKISEDVKSDQGVFASDAVPTIDCWDVYFWDDSNKKKTGWKRRIILDTPAISTARDSADTKTSRAESKNWKDIAGGRNRYLFNSGDRIYGTRLSNLIHHQYADGSVVAPFRYHSVRSLGFLLYAVCHLQNRLRCKLNDAAFEDLMQYFRFADPNDRDKITKLDLVQYGIIPDGVSFVPKTDRWQVNHQLAQLMMNLNRQSMAESSSSYNQEFGADPQAQRQEKTATQVAAEMNASTAMVGAMLSRAYKYQEFQDVEICRRFCIKRSSDIDVRSFQKDAMTAGVPAEYLDVTRWQVSHERVIGNGNKQLELAQSDMLMGIIDRYDPDSQRIVLRDRTFAITGDPAKTNELVPMKKTDVTHSVHDAQLSAGSLMSGVQMGLKQGVNHAEYAATLIATLSAKVEEIMALGGVAPIPVIAGLENLAGQTVDGQPVPGNGALNHIEIVGQVKESKAMVKQLSDALGQAMNQLKGIAQRAVEQQQAAQQENGGLTPEAAAKIKSQVIIAEAKAANSRASHEQKLKQREENHELQMANEIRRTQVDEAATDLRTAGDIRREGNKLLREQDQEIPA